MPTSPPPSPPPSPPSSPPSGRPGPSRLGPPPAADAPPPTDANSDVGSPLDDDLSEEEDEEGDHGLDSQSPDDDGEGLPLLVPASAVTVSPAAAGPFAHVARASNP